MSIDTVRYTEERELYCEKQRGGAYEWRSRLHHGIVYAEGGGGWVIIGSKRYRFTDGDAVVLCEGVGARLEADGEETRMNVTVFRSYFVSEATRAALKVAAPIVRSPGLGRILSELIGRIAAELRSEDALSRDLCRAYAIELSAATARALNEFEEQAETCPAVSTALAYIAEHSAERLSLSDMAATCKVSAAYLSRRFKAEVGIGFADYIATFRLQRAETMLREKPEMSVTEIAFSCGFNDSNYFSDKFKKHFGLSPLKFRKKSL